MTCGHCVDAVEKAVSGLVGVESASVDLVPGGTS
ncbi:cation transporter [Arthrobacter sp. H16F315]|nr:cation transporter [Arthrobacter sp. H16F315]MDD1478564.1 cation transporter [Arthrobacter sp. H16F315]